MATIVNPLTGQKVVLSFQHVFGRNAQNSNTYQRELDVSHSHLTVFWRTGHWYVKDHSRNGTLLDGEYIHQTTKKIFKERWFQVGKEESTKWQIIDLDPPSSYLKSFHDPNQIIKLSSFHAFPSEDSLQVVLGATNDKRWFLEENDCHQYLKHGQSVVIDAQTWIFVENEVIEETQDVDTALKDACFLFHLSRDEEHTNLRLIVSDEQDINLGNRACHYILLALARKRIDDWKLGLSRDEQGWVYVEDLLKELSKELQKEVDVYYLNLQIYRLRKQLSESKQSIKFSSSIIGRRPPGLIRVEHTHLKIIKDGEPVGELLLKE